MTLSISLVEVALGQSPDPSRIAQSILSLAKSTGSKEVVSSKEISGLADKNLGA